MPVFNAFGSDATVIAAYVFGLVLIYVLGRMFFMPLKLIFNLLYNALIGGVMLWVVNFLGGHIGFTLTINPLTAVIAGFLGLPGVLLLILIKLFIM